MSFLLFLGIYKFVTKKKPVVLHKDATVPTEGKDEEKGQDSILSTDPMPVDDLNKV